MRVKGNNGVTYIQIEGGPSGLIPETKTVKRQQKEGHVNPRKSPTQKEGAEEAVLVLLDGEDRMSSGIRAMEQFRRRDIEVVREMRELPERSAADMVKTAGRGITRSVTNFVTKIFS